MVSFELGPLRRNDRPDYRQSSSGLAPLSFNGDTGLRHVAATLVMLTMSLGASTPLAAQSGFGFTGALGWESVSGGASQVLESGITGEFDIYYSFGEMIAHASRDVYLVPGDIISSGPVGKGSLLDITSGEGPWLKPGDLVELEIEGLGVLPNQVGAASGP